MMNKTMFCKVVLLIALGSCIVSATFTIPEPSIQAFRPRGLSVSIPHTNGIRLFGFHGNINKPVPPLASGEISGDVLHRHGDCWTFKDPSVKLKIGDKIHYWFYITKDQNGYLQDERVYEIKDIRSESEVSCNNVAHASVDEKMTTERPNPELDLHLRLCEKVVLNLTQTLLNLQHEIDSLRETNDILRNMVAKDSNMARTISLDGNLPNDNYLVTTVQDIIWQKLDLPIRIDGVQRKSNRTVEFQVGTLDEKLTIMKAAKEKLKHSKYTIY